MGRSAIVDGCCQINAITALNFMVETGAFEKIPREGSVTAKELSECVGIEDSAIGKTYFSVPSYNEQGHC